MSPPPVFNISGQVINANVTGTVLVSGQVQVQGQIGAVVSGCLGIHNCSGQVLNTTGMSVTVNVYSNSGGVTSGDVVTIVSGMNLPLNSGAVVQNSGWAISGEVAQQYFHSGKSLSLSATSGAYLQVMNRSGLGIIYGTFDGDGITLDSASGLTQQLWNASGIQAETVACLDLWVVSGHQFQFSGIYLTGASISGMAHLSDISGQFTLSGTAMSSSQVWQVSGFAQASGVYALSGTGGGGLTSSDVLTMVSGQGLYMFSGSAALSGSYGAYGSYSNYASGLTVSGHAFGIIYPGTYRMSIDGQYYTWHNASDVTVSIVKNASTLNTAFNRIENGSIYSPTAQAACQALNFLVSGDIIDFQFSTVDHGQATINRVGD